MAKCFGGLILKHASDTRGDVYVSNQQAGVRGPFQEAGSVKNEFVNLT